MKLNIPADRLTAKFPKELLQESVHQRLRFFHEQKLRHPNLHHLEETLFRVTIDPGSAELLFVMGPSGVGKTTLIEDFEKKLVQHFYAEMENDAGFIPIVRIEAKAPHGKGNFSWSDLYTEVLRILNPVLMDDRNRSWVQRLKLDELRRDMLKALHHRKTRVMIIDEAQHLGKVASGKSMNDQMNNLKTIFNLTGVTIILVGTYELLPVNELSGQLGRRSFRYDFFRYMNTNRRDIEIFTNVVLEFQRRLPFQEMPDLLSHVEELYAHSIGCVGILKNWLERALSLALHQGDDTMRLEHLQATAHDADTCMRLLAEAQAGEASFYRRKESEELLRQACSFSVGLESTRESVFTETKEHKRHRPGQRRPTRDKTGTEV
ncbi:ATP-binding protein [Alicyclobacillus acidiphilus]|uniref:ATP-binding protein n=1 Tax=Alicyclobacillus acidiphilus TaxID=182455 RepID=UPI00082EFB2E|nr:ATP-binding protein [Alicyclobacillus acidiphilus]